MAEFAVEPVWATLQKAGYEEESKQVKNKQYHMMREKAKKLSSDLNKNARSKKTKKKK